MRTALATMGFLLVAAFFLSTEHRAHLFGLLPYLLLLACPFLHLFAHGGHDHGAADRPADDRPSHEGHGVGREARP